MCEWICRDTAALQKVDDSSNWNWLNRSLMRNILRVLHSTNAIGGLVAQGLKWNMIDMITNFNPSRTNPLRFRYSPFLRSFFRCILSILDNWIPLNNCGSMFSWLPFDFRSLQSKSHASVRSHLNAWVWSTQIWVREGSVASHLSISWSTSRSVLSKSNLHLFDCFHVFWSINIGTIHLAVHHSSW